MFAIRCNIYFFDFVDSRFRFVSLKIRAESAECKLSFFFYSINANAYNIIPIFISAAVLS